MSRVKGSDMLAAHEITDLPAFNDLQKRVREFFAGHATLEAVQHEGEVVNEILGSLLATFHAEVRYQVPSEDLEEASLLVYEEFSLLRVELPLVTLAAESQDSEAAEEHLEASRGSLQAILQVFAELRQQELERPRLSPIPLAHEVLRVGQLVLDETLPQELLGERLQQYRLFHERLSDSLAGMQPTEPERPVWEQCQSNLKEALTLQDGAIRALEQSLQRQDHGLLEIGLEQLQEATEELVAVQQALALAGQRPAKRHCPRCSHENAYAARHCGQCGAQLPVAERTASTVVVHEQADDHPAPQIQQLLLLAEACANHEADPAELLTEVAALEHKIETAQRRLKSLKTPPPETPEDQLELYQTTRQEMQDCLELFAEGLARLRDGHAGATRQVEAAAEGLLQIQPRWEAFLRR